MDHFTYTNGMLHCEAIPIAALAEQYQTPLYVYSRRTLTDHYTRLRDAFALLAPSICYSVKSCSNLHILRVLRELGSSFDVVSGGEMQRVLEAGGDPATIVFAGVGKTDAEIDAALRADIGFFNVESEAEMANLAHLAADRRITARAALRVNPDVDPHTHQYTTTGKKETKFGVDFENARRVFDTFRGHRCLDLCALHLHIGSPVNRVEPYEASLAVALDLVADLRARGHAVRAVNIGGGFGAHYDGSEAPPASAYAERIVPLLADSGLKVLLEPGRSIAANAGVLITRALYTKSSGTKQFVIVDAAITELIRPALYGSFHFAWPVQPRSGLIPPDRRADLQLAGTEKVDIVGPVCESGDFLARDRYLPPIQRGDLVCIFTTGAYGFTMSSQYNSRPRAAEVLIEGDTARLIRRRETYDDLVVAERL